MKLEMQLRQETGSFQVIRIQDKTQIIRIPGNRKCSLKMFLLSYGNR